MVARILIVILLFCQSLFAENISYFQKTNRANTYMNCPGFKAWFKYYQSIDATFSLKEFCWNGEESSIKSQVDFIEGPVGRQDIRQPLYYFSKDKKKYIDPFVTLYQLKMKKDSVIVDRDIDQIVALYDKTNNTEIILSQSGPCGRIDEVAWLNNDICIVMGQYWVYPDTLTNNGTPPRQYHITVVDVKRKTRKEILGPVRSWDFVHKMFWEKPYEAAGVKRLKKAYKKLRWL